MTRKGKGLPRLSGPDTEFNRNKRDSYYVDAEEYTKEVLNFRKTGLASERLGELFKLHVDRYASSANFKGYTYLDEMKGMAILFLMKYANKFDDKKMVSEGKTPNAFNYCTTIIHRAFLQIIAKEKKHSELKDKIIKAQDEIMKSGINLHILDQMIIDEEIS